MTLTVYTARISSRDPDRFDITRKSGGPDGWPFAPSQALLSAAKSGRLSFGEYEPRYVDEMRRSYRDNRAAWNALLARPRVVLCCYCADPAECHRSLLAGILGKIGAEIRGEVGLDEAVSACKRATEEAGKLTARDVIEAELATGVERCVLWATLERIGFVRKGTYAAHSREIAAHAKAMASAAPGSPPSTSAN